MDKSEVKIVYQYDSTGLYVCEMQLDWTDRSPISGRWQIPGGCTEIEPPKARKGYSLYFDIAKKKWSNKKDPEPEKEPEPAEPTKEEKLAAIEIKYQEDKQNIFNAYLNSIMYNDNDLLADLKAEIVELDTQYDLDYEAIESEDEK